MRFSLIPISIANVVISWYTYGSAISVQLPLCLVSSKPLISHGETLTNVRPIGYTITRPTEGQTAKVQDADRTGKMQDTVHPGEPVHWLYW